jgi:hypothetical protein
MEVVQLTSLEDTHSYIVITHRLDNGAQFPAWQGYFIRHHFAQTGSGAHPVVTWGSFLRE